MLTFREEFRLHGHLTQDRQDELIDILEQVQKLCSDYDELCLDTPEEGTPERILFDTLYNIHNVTAYE